MIVINASTNSTNIIKYIFLAILAFSLCFFTYINRPIISIIGISAIASIFNNGKNFSMVLTSV